MDFPARRGQQFYHGGVARQAFVDLLHQEQILGAGQDVLAGAVPVSVHLFASLPDMGLPLPSYSEHIIRMNMTPAILAQYAKLDASQDSPPTGLLAWALEEQKREDKKGKGAISVWRSAIFNGSNAMVRDEQIVFNRCLKGKGRFAVRRPEQAMEADAVSNGLLSKESWLVDTCRAQVFAGLKPLVFTFNVGNWSSKLSFASTSC